MIKGSELRKAFISASNHIGNLRQEVDALNVFPVPDGDTGTNMSMTISAAAKELEHKENENSVGDVAHTAASALLRGARGNSGVILSLLFRGFSKGLAGKTEADGEDIALALRLGVEAAYKAVMKPTEGTILTVARMAAEAAQEYCIENPNADAVDVFEKILEAAKIALDKTPEMLPVLKKAGVVDAGGRGFVVIIEGMLSVLRDGVVISPSNAQTSKDEPLYNDKNAAGEYEGEITFTYCTEFIVLKNEDADDPLKLRAYLESIGDCVVVVDDEDIIKVHVHTDNPGNALQNGLKFGMLTNMKIENMREQHAAANKAAKNAQKETSVFEYTPVDPEVEYGFVAVAAGEGIQNLFRDLGVNNIVSGGQTMNPSTEDILEAIHATPAKTVFVLPNNKNIIMAAEQAIKLADRKVCVLPTRTIPQGVCAMLAFDPDADVAENQLNMTKGFDHVKTGQLTFAARDSDIDGKEIKQGEIIALENGKLTHSGKDLNKTAVKTVRSMCDKDTAFVTVYYGEDVTEEQAQELEELLKAKVSDDIEITFINGGQPVYYYIISAE